MKKHEIAVTIGVVALAANLLLPNLAFGQTQQGSLQITCPISGFIPPSLEAAPRDVTFNGVSSPSSGTVSTVDTDAGDFTTTGAFPGGNSSTSDINGPRVTNDHLLRIKDTTSLGINGCHGPDAYDNYNVSAIITTSHDPSGANIPALINSDDSDYIPASSMKLVTTDAVNITNIDNGQGPSIVGVKSTGVYYDDYTSTGNAHGATTPNAAGSGGTLGGYNFTTLGFSDGTYRTVTNANFLNSSVVVIRHCVTNGGGNSGENADLYLGVVIGIGNGIHTLQKSGTYSGTIEYTFTNGIPAGCP